MSEEEEMKLTLPKGIVTKRLDIRPHTTDDYDAFVEFVTDDVATRFLNFEPEQKTAQGARELLDFIIASYATENPVFALAITERDNGAYLGACGLSPLSDDEGVECYFWLLPRYWGWGYATEAIRALLYFAFVELGLKKVVTNIASDNTGAKKVAENAGMTDEGPVKPRELPAGARFAMTNTEYASMYQ